MNAIAICFLVIVGIQVEAKKGGHGGGQSGGLGGGQSGGHGGGQPGGKGGGYYGVPFGLCGSVFTCPVVTRPVFSDGACPFNATAPLTPPACTAEGTVSTVTACAGCRALNGTMSGETGVTISFTCMASYHSGETQLRARATACA